MANQTRAPLRCKFDPQALREKYRRSATNGCARKAMRSTSRSKASSRTTSKIRMWRRSFAGP